MATEPESSTEASTVWHDADRHSFRFTNPRGHLLIDGSTGEPVVIPYNLQFMDEASQVHRSMAMMDELFG